MRMDTLDKVWNIFIAIVFLVVICLGMFVWWPNYQNTITNCEISDIAYDTTYTEDSSLYPYEGYTDEGTSGEYEECYYRSGELATEKVLQNPIDEVEVTGTKVVAPIQSLFSQRYEEDEEEYLCEGYPTVCDDSTCSYSTGRGTCSWHGGVWYYN